MQDVYKFTIAFDKYQEDWGFTEKLGKYGVEQVVAMLSDPEYADDKETKEWKEEYKKWLTTQLAKLG
ncbi:hypothetical protein D3C78_1630050 [compost metagenome]